MNKNLTFKIFCLGVLLGCAGMQPQTTFMDNTFTSDLPKLKVRILKNVWKDTEKSKQGVGYNTTHYRFNTGPGELVGITISRYRHTSSAEWRSSDEQIVFSMGSVPLGPIIINNETWIKFAYFEDERYLVVGYFKRIDWNLVSVYRVTKNEEYKNEIESFNKTRVLTEQLNRLINEAFDDIEGLFVIE